MLWCEGKQLYQIIILLHLLSEKLQKPLQSNVVPVVYGADDVHKVAPPHSYIDVRDFTSPKHLAEYLLHLHRNNSAYLSYFQWKKEFEVFRAMYSHKKVFCLFCHFLHTSNSTRILQDFQKWFFLDSQCKQPDII